MEIGKKIAQLRKEKGLSQKALADKSGLGISTIQKIEYGSFHPKQATIKKLANALDVASFDIDNNEIDDVAIEMLMKQYLNSPYKEALDFRQQLLQHLNLSDTLIVKAYLSLTDEGKQKVSEYIDLLMPKYKKADTHSNE